MNNPERGIESI